MTLIDIKTSSTASYAPEGDLKERIFKAAAFLSPLWPLQTAIACNPLMGQIDTPFWQAIEKVDRLYSAPLAGKELISAHMIKWCQAFFDEGQAPWAMPGREKGLYRAVLDLLPFDDSLIRHEREKSLLASLPQDPFALLQKALHDHDEGAIAARLSILPGWAGYIVWYSSWSGEKKYPCDLIDFLALQVMIQLIIDVSEDISLYPQKEVVLPQIDACAVEEKEKKYREHLLEKIMDSFQGADVEQKKIDGQLVFCIDCRSEPLRRHLEHQGPWKTYGFAGFFGLAIKVQNAIGLAHSSCPVLLKPQHNVVLSGDKPKRISSLLHEIFSSMKYRFGASVALAEITGAFFGALMAWRLFKRAKKGSSIRACCATPSSFQHDLSLEQQVDIAHTALSMMGMKEFSPVVVFCGHGSTTTNNPHASALDCGACGGGPGGVNAQLLAKILSDTHVQDLLEKKGIKIPASTRFIGAQHDTTSDTVTLYGVEGGSSEIVDALQKDLSEAARLVAKEKARLLQSSDTSSVRSSDWSQVRSEWGLAKNASFIVAPREITKQIDLEGRSFLHSYDWQIDSGADYLKTILTAPMIVAQWINAQYFFSAIRPQFFGSGSKVTHNVLGKIGVMQGVASDLMSGLPYQSLYDKERKMYHEPMRLSSFVVAPLSVVESIIQKEPLLQNLLSNQWLYLTVIDPIEKKAFPYYRRDIVTAPSP